MTIRKIIAPLSPTLRTFLKAEPESFWKPRGTKLMVAGSDFSNGQLGFLYVQLGFYNLVWLTSGHPSF